MSEEIRAPVDAPNYTQTQKTNNTVAVAAIVAITMIILACILACTVTAYIFILNAPW